MENIRWNDRADFQKKIEKLPKQKQRALIEKILQQVVKAEGRTELKQLLNEIHGTVKPVVAPAPQVHRRSRWRRLLGWTAAASILLLTPFWLGSHSASPQRLHTQYYQAYELSVLTRDDTQHALLLAANSLYQQGNYQEAIPAFEKALHIEPQGQLYLGLGISYLEVGEYTQAKKQLQHLYQLQDPLLKDQAVWYLALLALQQGALKQSQHYLKMLCNDPHADHHLEAKEIIKELE